MRITLPCDPYAGQTADYNYPRPFVNKDGRLLEDRKPLEIEATRIRGDIVAAPGQRPYFPGVLPH